MFACGCCSLCVTGAVCKAQRSSGAPALPGLMRCVSTALVCSSIGVLRVLGVFVRVAWAAWAALALLAKAQLGNWRLGEFCFCTERVAILSACLPLFSSADHGPPVGCRATGSSAVSYLQLLCAWLHPTATRCYCAVTQAAVDPGPVLPPTCSFCPLGDCAMDARSTQLWVPVPALIAALCCQGWHRLPELSCGFGFVALSVRTWPHVCVFVHAPASQEQPY